jgi:hypothetical protein
VVKREWSNESGQTRVVEREWSNESGRTRVVEREWSNESGQTRAPASIGSEYSGYQQVGERSISRGGGDGVESEKRCTCEAPLNAEMRMVPEITSADELRTSTTHALHDAYARRVDGAGMHEHPSRIRAEKLVHWDHGI